MVKGKRFVIAMLLGTSGCAYMPVTHGYSKWSAQICGRKTFLQRLCTGTAIFFLLPVYLVTLAIDIPLGLLEFVFGYAPFKDPLLKAGQFPWRDQSFPGNEPGTMWTVTKDGMGSEQFLVKKSRGGIVAEEFIVEPRQGGELGIWVIGGSPVAKRLKAWGEPLGPATELPGLL